MDGRGVGEVMVVRGVGGVGEGRGVGVEGNGVEDAADGADEMAMRSAWNASGVWRSFEFWGTRRVNVSDSNVEVVARVKWGEMC